MTVAVSVNTGPAISRECASVVKSNGTDFGYRRKLASRIQSNECCLHISGLGYQ